MPKDADAKALGSPRIGNRYNHLSSSPVKNGYVRPKEGHNRVPIISCDFNVSQVYLSAVGDYLQCWGTIFDLHVGDHHRVVLSFYRNWKSLSRFCYTGKSKVRNRHLAQFHTWNTMLLSLNFSVNMLKKVVVQCNLNVHFQTNNAKW